MLRNGNSYTHGLCTAHAKQSLTPRETQHLSLLGNGMSTKEIAGQMGVSVNCAKANAKSIYKKLGAKSGTQAIIFVIRSDLIEIHRIAGALFFCILTASTGSIPTTQTAHDRDDKYTRLSRQLTRSRPRNRREHDALKATQIYLDPFNHS